LEESIATIIIVFDSLVVASNKCPSACILGHFLVREEKHQKIFPYGCHLLCYHDEDFPLGFRKYTAMCDIINTGIPCFIPFYFIGLHK
jgi:hypothetical protein